MEMICVDPGRVDHCAGSVSAIINLAHYVCMVWQKNENHTILLVGNITDLFLRPIIHCTNAQPRSAL